MGSSVRIGGGTIVGIRASIATSITIGRNAIIGVGASVVNDVLDGEVVAGPMAGTTGNRK